MLSNVESSGKDRAPLTDVTLSMLDQLKKRMNQRISTHIESEKKEHPSKPVRRSNSSSSENQTAIESEFD